MTYFSRVPKRRAAAETRGRLLDWRPARSIGGPAAILAKESIKKVEVLEYPELGMEAVWKIEVQDFPAFILVDDKGNDFFVNSCGICVPEKN